MHWSIRGHLDEIEQVASICIYTDQTSWSSAHNLISPLNTWMTFVSIESILLALAISVALRLNAIYHCTIQSNRTAYEKNAQKIKRTFFVPVQTFVLHGMLHSIFNYANKTDLFAVQSCNIHNKPCNP